MVEIARGDASGIEGVPGQEGVGDLQQLAGGRSGGRGVYGHAFTDIQVAARLRAARNVATEAVTPIGSPESHPANK
ncbi:hypothetical protein GCM10022419_056730 [Nonomuraea rosea]|uniref:Uncharacterized protein n=1 Tax=Nonomuraea rosea TaxID=638574 RepID=A0ABP6XKJ5_9ACTN